MPRKTLAALDPNFDLIGYSFPSENGTLTVTGTPKWSDIYVRCVGKRKFVTVRLASLLRVSRRIAS